MFDIHFKSPLVSIRSAATTVVSAKLPSVVRAEGKAEPTVRIPDAELRGLADQVDRFYGNANGAVELDEIAKYRAKLSDTIGGLSAVRDAQPYGSELYQKTQRSIDDAQGMLVRAGHLEAHVKLVKTSLVADLADKVKRDSLGLVGAIARRLQDVSAEMLKSTTKGIALDVSVSSKKE